MIYYVSNIQAQTLYSYSWFWYRCVVVVCVNCSSIGLRNMYSIYSYLRNSGNKWFVVETAIVLNMLRSGVWSAAVSTKVKKVSYSGFQEPARPPRAPCCVVDLQLEAHSRLNAHKLPMKLPLINRLARMMDITFAICFHLKPSRCFLSVAYPRNVSHVLSRLSVSYTGSFLNTYE